MTPKQTARWGKQRGGGGRNERRLRPYGNTAPAHAQPVCRPDGLIIGHVANDVFLKRARGSIHMLRAPRGWALDAPTLAELRALGVATVTITDTETGTVYTAPLAEFEAHGVAFNRGAGPQVALPLGYWRVNGQPPALARRESNPDAPRQLSLFEGVP
jgi:hypothetical protein